MTTKEYNHYRAAAALGLIPDEENPLFLFNQTHKDLLLDIINRKIDAAELARMELKNRGLNEKGRFVGWKNDTLAHHT
jgi:hypothetical protein